MYKLKSIHITQYIESLIVAILLVFIMHNVGSAAGKSVLYLQKEYRIELFNQAIQEEGLVAKMISDETVHSVTSKYIAALADAVVHFEFFPRNDDAKMFIEFISVVPYDISIEKFEFSGHNIMIYCHAESKGSLLEFSKTLKTINYFRDISLECFQKADSSYIATITCIAA